MAKKVKADPKGKAAGPAPEPAVPERISMPFPVVGVGASAGGIEAVTELLHNLGETPGMAIVFVLHQDRHHASLLSEVLSRATPMPVAVVSEGALLQADRVYVAPPDAEVHVRDGVLHLQPLAKRGPTMPVDALFYSLAEDQGSRAIGVILSGSASDGALGTKAIKAEGGITFTQDESAKFDGMPRSAVAAGSIDFILPPKDIAKELKRIAQHQYIVTSGAARSRFPDHEMAAVFAILRSAHDVDFTHYKPTTIERRVRRRMALRRVDTLADYVALLRKSSEEVEHLYADVLIRVTGFFRDPEVYEALSRDILPSMMKGRGNEAPVRVWVPGSATGEEVYSLAIVLLEGAASNGYSCPIQIFGTDVNDASVEHARAGHYPDSIAADVSPERLRRFFTREDNGYRVSKAVRDCCVFARQNLTKDPPFSKLDLISCRNVMIYLGALLQRQVISIFHYALRPNGFLLLGSSETIGNFPELFDIVDRKNKIYRKRITDARPSLTMRTPPRERRERVHMEDESVVVPNVLREADRVLLGRYSPPGVLVNEALDILQFRGRTSAFLEPAPGAASLNLLKMAREGLLAELRTAMHTARKKDSPVRRDGLRVRNNGGTMPLNIEVIPFTSGTRERYYLVLFEEGSAPVEEKTSRRKSAKADESADSRNVTRIKRELDATREYLQSIIEEQEAMNEELRSANEEIQSSNEELQSTNEELETAKEELQSSNEELTTLNEELENRNQELAILNNDLVNLLTSVDIPILMLDRELRIRRANVVAQRSLRLLPSDIGRPIGELKMPLEIDDLDATIATVIDDLEVREREVQDREGHAYSLRIRPCKTVENKIEGAVLVLVPVDLRKK